MSYETFSEQESGPEQHKLKLATYMDIQRELIMRTIKPGEDLDAHAFEWAIGDKGKEFYEVLEVLMQEHSNLAQEWEADCESVIAAIEERMHLRDSGRAA